MFTNVIFQLLLEWSRIKVVLGFNLFTATRNNPHYVYALVDRLDHSSKVGRSLARDTLHTKSEQDAGKFGVPSFDTSSYQRLGAVSQWALVESPITRMEHAGRRDLPAISGLYKIVRPLCAIPTSSPRQFYSIMQRPHRSLHQILSRAGPLTKTFADMNRQVGTTSR